MNENEAKVNIRSVCNKASFMFTSAASGPACKLVQYIDYSCSCRGRDVEFP